MSSSATLAAARPLPTHPQLWRASDLARVAVPSVSSGFSRLDEELPGKGWPVGSLTELLPAHEGIGELRVLGPALARLSAAGERLAWIAPPHLPYAPALAAAGIELANLVIVRTRNERETLWATEQALASNACGAVLSWISAPTFTFLRRLQLAAETGRTLAMLFRTPRAANDPTPAVLRIALHTLNGGLALRILKRRGAPLDEPIVISALPGHAEYETHTETEHAVDCPVPEEPAPRSVLPRRVLV